MTDFETLQWIYKQPPTPALEAWKKNLIKQIAKKEKDPYRRMVIEMLY